MNYIKAEKVLPPDLINEIHKYVSGECLYIPILPEARTEWGSRSGYRKELDERNKYIYSLYLDGLRISELAELYYLSEKSIYRIINQIKNKR